MYLVMGITGRVGGAVARHLLERGAQVRALVRDRGKANDWARRGVELVDGDWNDASAIAHALIGVKAVFAMLPTTFVPAPDFADSRAILSAYRSAFAQNAPERLVALSSIGADKRDGIGMITPLNLMEQSFRQLPFPVAFVRAGAFFENFLHGLKTGREGTLPVFYPQRLSEPFPMVATDDIGECVADILTGPLWHGNRTVELGTPTSANELATQLAAVLRCPVVAKPVPRGEWGVALEAMGLLPGQTQAAEQMFDAVNSGWIAFGASDAEQVRGKMTAGEVFAAALEERGS